MEHVRQKFDAQAPGTIQFKVAGERSRTTRERKNHGFGIRTNSIGQGIRLLFGTCVWVLKAAGYDTIIVINNPETVSTDFYIVDRYTLNHFTAEDVKVL